jgi:UrcA family protein
MFTKTTALAAFAVTGSLVAGLAAAKDHKVTVAVPVSAAGLDLSQPQDARIFYTRVQHAAYVVCTDGKRVDLAPADNQVRCYQKALGDAIRAAKQPMLTQIYLGEHTLQEAAAHGIQVPSQMAAK